MLFLVSTVHIRCTKITRTILRLDLFSILRLTENMSWWLHAVQQSQAFQQTKHTSEILEAFFCSVKQLSNTVRTSIKITHGPAHYTGWSRYSTTLSRHSWKQAHELLSAESVFVFFMVVESAEKLLFYSQI